MNSFSNEKEYLLEQLRAKEDMLERTTAFLTNSQNDLAHAYEKLSAINNEILASIRFAERIQKPLIAKSDIFNIFFSGSGLYVNQKSYIGGDFIYATGIKSGFIFGLFDCTGHGVPGAMLSIYNYSLLNEIIKVLDVTDPAMILNLVSSRLFNYFAQAPRNYNSETMDGTLCYYDFNSKLLTYSSAKRTALMIRGGIVSRLSMDKVSIGEGFNTRFISYTVALSPEDKILLFSDGLTDQYNHLDKSKYGKKRLIQFLETYAACSATELKQLLEAELLNWRGETEQTDDMSFLVLEI